MPARFVDAPPPSAGEPKPSDVIPEDNDLIVIHVLIDGFTAHGSVWYRGQEIEYSKSDPHYQDTLDRNGESWLDLDDAGQMSRWGKVYFRRGTWPGQSYAEEQARRAEEARKRRPQALGRVAPGRR